MDPSRFVDDAPGRLVPTVNGAIAFVPDLAPRTLNMSASTVRLLDQASNALGMLSGIGRLAPNPHLLIAPYLRREAVLSSRIEGTLSTIADVYAAEAGQTQLFTDADDVQEVRNYIEAHEHGLRRLETLPLSLRLIRELHAKLTRGVRGDDQTPGQFRRSQNFIGPPGGMLADASYVPPPPSEMMRCLDDLEHFRRSCCFRGWGE